MYIYQIDRDLLQKQIQKFSHYINGDVLDVGAGEFNRYEHFFKCKSFKTLDYSGKVDIVASADNIPVADNTFDSVCSMQMLEHVRFPEKCVQEMFRVLKPGGYALVTAPQWNELHEEPHDYWRYTCYGFKDLFERNGFKEIARDQRGGFFSNLSQMIMRFLMSKYSLHNKKIIGRVFSKIFLICGKFAIWLDARGGVVNKRHAIGWAFVFQKPKI